MPTLTLLTRSGCHLCEEAESLLNNIQPVPLYRKLDIDEDHALYEKYSLRIPVVQITGDCELSWPFDANDIVTLLNDCRDD